MNRRAFLLGGLAAAAAAILGRFLRRIQPRRLPMRRAVEEPGRVARFWRQV